jgi:hypothetical protein
MHWRTFNAPSDRIAAAEEEKGAASMVGAARLLGRMPVSCRSSETLMLRSST